MDKLLSELNQVADRSAQFRTVVALNLGDKKLLFEGICKGEILNKKQGEKGFGYDPVFSPKNYNVSFAEMSMKEKGDISHRGIAIRKLIAFLNK